MDFLKFLLEISFIALYIHANDVANVQYHLLIKYAKYLIISISVRQVHQNILQRDWWCLREHLLQPENRVTLRIFREFWMRATDTTAE